MSTRDVVYVGHMLDKVVHDYLGVDEDIVWQVVIEDCPNWWRRSNRSSRRRNRPRTSETDDEREAARLLHTGLACSSNGSTPSR